MTDYKLTTSVACLRHHILTSQGTVDSTRLKDLELMESHLEVLPFCPETDLKQKLETLLYETVLSAVVDWADSQVLPAQQYTYNGVTRTYGSLMTTLRTPKGVFQFLTTFIASANAWMTTTKRDGVEDRRGSLSSRNLRQSHLLAVFVFLEKRYDTL